MPFNVFTRLIVVVGSMLAVTASILAPLWVTRYFISYGPLESFTAFLLSAAVVVGVWYWAYFEMENQSDE